MTKNSKRAQRKGSGPIVVDGKETRVPREWRGREGRERERERYIEREKGEKRKTGQRVRPLIGLPPLWQFSVSCRIPTHWKLRNTEEAQKGYGFEIKRTLGGDGASARASAVCSATPRENKPFPRSAPCPLTHPRRHETETERGYVATSKVCRRCWTTISSTSPLPPTTPERDQPLAGSAKRSSA